MTTNLAIEVTVENGVAHLHATVPTLLHAENAEVVAARKPGVREVSREVSEELCVADPG
ncbi:MAG TPA: BON domain-containing protein [Ktedonobacterales bacterium]|nr:BON domain-containing protein [Ktedonobacterales bacterium]